MNSVEVREWGHPKCRSNRTASLFVRKREGKVTRTRLIGYSFGASWDSWLSIVWIVWKSSGIVSLIVYCLKASIVTSCCYCDQWQFLRRNHSNWLLYKCEMIGISWRIWRRSRSRFRVDCPFPKSELLVTTMHKDNVPNSTRETQVEQTDYVLYVVHQIKWLVLLTWLS